MSLLDPRFWGGALLALGLAFGLGYGTGDLHRLQIERSHALQAKLVAAQTEVRQATVTAQVSDRAAQAQRETSAPAPGVVRGASQRARLGGQPQRIRGVGPGGEAGRRVVRMDVAGPDRDRHGDGRGEALAVVRARETARAHRPFARPGEHHEHIPPVVGESHAIGRRIVRPAILAGGGRRRRSGKKVREMGSHARRGGAPRAPLDAHTGRQKDQAGQHADEHMNAHTTFIRLGRSSPPGPHLIATAAMMLRSCCATKVAARHNEQMHESPQIQLNSSRPPTEDYMSPLIL